MEIYVQRDGALAVQQALRAAPFLAGIRIRRTTSPNLTVDDGPYMTVSSDGTPSSGRATATENVRVAVFSKYEPEARSLAAWVEAYLRNPKLPLGFATHPGASLIVAVDEDINGFVAAVTVRVAAPKNGVNV